MHDGTQRSLKENEIQQGFGNHQDRFLYLKFLPKIGNKNPNPQPNPHPWENKGPPF